MCQCQYFSYVIPTMSWNSLANVVEKVDDGGFPLRWDGL